MARYEDILVGGEGFSAIIFRTSGASLSSGSGSAAFSSSSTRSALVAERVFIDATNFGAARIHFSLHKFPLTRCTVHDGS